MQFIDEAEVYLKAGDGGAGAVAFRREKFVPRGGPSGGDGGNGSDIILESDERLTTLLDFRFKREYRAKSGEPGRGRDQNGHGALELILRVPPGTMVRDAQTGELLIDMRLTGTRFIIAKGGRGGLGNMNFATPTLQAPRFAQPGTEGEEKTIKLELRLLADVGLVGFPNAGKSTLVARLSRARPKIADYPFTTLTPHLGVVQYKDGKSFVLTDLPGLIEGAHRGQGLGTRFLRHMQRCRAIVHLVDASAAPISGRDLLADFDAINRELYMFDRGLAEKSQVIAANKIDVGPEAREAAEAFQAALGKRGLHVHLMSGATGEGVPELVDAMVRALEGAPMPSPFDHDALDREIAEEKARDEAEAMGEEYTAPEVLKPEDFGDESSEGAPAKSVPEAVTHSEASAEIDKPVKAKKAAKAPRATREKPIKPDKEIDRELEETVVDEREEAATEKQKRAPALTGRRKDGMFKEKAARSEQPLGNKFRPTSEAAALLLAKAARADGGGKRVVPKVREAKAPEPRKKITSVDDMIEEQNKRRKPVDEKTRARNEADQKKQRAEKISKAKKKAKKALPPSKRFSAKARRKPNE